MLEDTFQGTRDFPTGADFITDPFYDILHSLPVEPRLRSVVICRLIISAVAVILNFVRFLKDCLNNFVYVENTPVVIAYSTNNLAENRKVKTAFGDYFSVQTSASKIR